MKKPHLLLIIAAIIVAIVLVPQIVREPSPDQTDAVKTFCSPESREAEACITLYQPVCGWNDPEKIQCIKYPCAQTYSNNCFACIDENILYHTEGECPE